MGYLNNPFNFSIDVKFFQAKKIKRGEKARCGTTRNVRIGGIPKPVHLQVKKARLGG